MKTARTLFHIMRADFFERARRYSFLITLGLTIFAAYIYLPQSDVNYQTLGLGGYRGVYNSAWVGGAVSVLCSVLLSLPAFYLVKNAVERDEQTRVGQIIATTPLSKPLYTLGKAVSNFIFLSVMVGVIAVAAGAMQLIRAEVSHIDLWALFSPFIFFVLPVMAMIAALAIFFETIPFLCGTFGNVVYFILWLAMVIVSATSTPSPPFIRDPANDLWGIQVLLSGMMKDTVAAFPDYPGSVTIGMGTLQAPLQTFTWNGIQLTGKIIFGRLLWMIAAIGLSLFAALFFRRFDPAPQKHQSKSAAETQTLPPLEIVQPPPSLAPLHLSPLISNRRAFYPLRVLLVELRLLFKGIRWWWLIIVVGLNIAGLLIPTESARQYLLPVVWIMPLALWSALGTRERRHNTDQLVFSTQHPLSRQFPIAWLAGVAMTLVIGAGVGSNLVIAGDWLHLFALVIGALFIPTLAFALGVWSGTNKLFEVVYMLWWYIGPINQAEGLDFMGASSNLQLSHVVMYGLFTVVLFIIAVLGRKRQIKR